MQNKKLKMVQKDVIKKGEHNEQYCSFQKL